MSRWFEILRIIGPILIMTSTNSRVRLLGPTIIEAIARAESLVRAHGDTQVPGSEKKAIAVDLVGLGAVAFNQARGVGTDTPLIDVDELQVSAGHLIDGVIGAVNALHRAEVPAAPSLPTAADLPHDPSAPVEG